MRVRKPGCLGTVLRPLREARRSMRELLRVCQLHGTSPSRQGPPHSHMRPRHIQLLGFRALGRR